VTGTADSGRVIGERLVEEDDFTAVFVANDQMALGLLHAHYSQGITVPSAMSIVGFDDIPKSRALLAAAHHHPTGLHRARAADDADGLGCS